MLLWRLLIPFLRIRIKPVLKTGGGLVLLVALLSGCGLMRPKQNRPNKAQVQQDVDFQYTALLYDASKEKMLGNLKDAAVLYASCLRLKPNSATAMYELAGINTVLNDLPAALELAKGAAQIEPKNKWFQLLLAELYVQQQQLPEAIKVYQLLAHQYPNNSEYAVDLALLLATNGDLTEALNVYDKLEKSVGPSEQLLMNKHSLYRMLGKTDKIVETLEQLISLCPFEAKYYGLYAEYFVDMKQYDKAFAQYQRLQEISPQNGLVHLSLANLYVIINKPEKVFDELKLAFENPDVAIETKLRALLQLLPFNYSSIQNVATDKLFAILKRVNADEYAVYQVHAEYQIKAKNYSEARDNLRKALAINQSNLSDWEQLLSLDLQLNDNDFLIEDSEKGLEYFPNQGVLYYYQGVGYYNKGEYENAIDILSTGLNMAVDNPNLQGQLYIFLAESHNHLKQYEKSDDWFDEALKLFPDNKYVLNNYSYYLSERGEKLDDALKMIRKVMAQDPESGTYLDTYAWVLYKQGKYEESRAVLEKAISGESGNSAVVVEHYGDVLYKLGEKEAAQRQWKKADKLGKGSHLLQEKLKRKELIE